MKKRRSTNDFRTAVFFILPGLSGFVIFLVIPILFAFLVSFTSYTGSFKNFELVGLDNYRLIFRDDKFWQSMSVTLVFVVVSVIFQVLLGFFFALLLNKRFIARTFFRSVIFLPAVLSSLAVCLSFTILFNPTQGLVNKFLESIGLHGSKWLAHESTALMSIIIVVIWQSFGYYMIIFLSGLQTVNLSLYEAAELDGASERHKLLHVTIPALTPVIFFCLIIAMINAFKTFDQVYIMTGGQYGGGPAGSTSVLAFDIYKNGFLFWQVGYGAAESVILFLMVLALTVLQYKIQEKWVNYDIV